MNLPNKLTLSRILLIPVFVVISYLQNLLTGSVEILTFNVPVINLYLIIVFIIASSTDFLDGMIARKYNMVTTFGKLMDPLADKLLVTSALLIMVEYGLIPAWIPIVILSREFLVTGIRTLAVNEGKVIAASNIGKLKTVSQMIMIPVVFFLNTTYDVTTFGFADFWIYLATLLTIVSGLDYFIKNKDIILASK